MFKKAAFIISFIINAPKDINCELVTRLDLGEGQAGKQREGSAPIDISLHSEFRGALAIAEVDIGAFEDIKGILTFNIKQQ